MKRKIARRDRKSLEKKEKTNLKKLARRISPELKNQLKLRANKGRPSIEADQPVRIIF